MIIDETGLSSVLSRIKSLPDETKNEVIADVNEYALELLSTYPERVEHGASNPYKWQTEKQRRAYFATNGFGAGIPYNRTGDLGNSWSANRTGDVVTFTNSAPYAGYVMGDRIQRGHIADGWRTIKQFLAGELSFRSSRFRNVVMSAYQRAIRKLKLG